jgi:hypothetical protein
MTKVMHSLTFILLAVSMALTPVENSYAKKTKEEKEAERAEKKAKQEAEREEKKAKKKAECDAKGGEWKDTKKGKCSMPKEQIWVLNSSNCKQKKIKKDKIQKGLGDKYFNSDSECMAKLAPKCESKGKKVDEAKRKCAKDDNKKNCENLAKVKKKASAEISSEIDSIIAGGTCSKDQVKEFKKKAKEENKEKKNCDKLAKEKKNASDEIAREIDAIVQTGNCTKDQISDFKKKVRAAKKDKKSCDKLEKLKKDASEEIASEIDSIVRTGECSKDQYKDIKQKLKAVNKDKKAAGKKADCEAKAAMKWDSEKNRCVKDDSKLEGLEVFELKSRTGECTSVNARKAAKTKIDNIKYFSSDADCRAKAGSIADVIIYKKDKSGSCSPISGPKAVRQAKKIDNKKYFKTEADCTKDGGSVVETIYVQKKSQCVILKDSKAQKFKDKSSNAGKFWSDKASCDAALNSSSMETVYELKKKLGGKRVCQPMSEKKSREMTKEKMSQNANYFIGREACETKLKEVVGSTSDVKKCYDFYVKTYRKIAKGKMTAAQGSAFMKSKKCSKADVDQKK